MADDDELPKPEDIEVELNDIYRHDEEQAYLTLMSQEVKSLNFAVEANYTVRLCKEIINHHYPDQMPLGSFELVASNKVRSDEETLSEVFNGDPYACEKEPAEDPCFDWVPRKEQIFDEKKLMQMSIFKKEWDADNNEYEPVDLGYMAYGYEQTRKWRKMGYLNDKGLLKEEEQLIHEGLITDQTTVLDFKKKQALIKKLRAEYCVREKHAKEVVNEIRIKDDVNEAIEWLRFHKEKDWNIAEKLKTKKDAGEKYEVEEESEVDDDVEIYVCEPLRLGGF